MLSIFNPLRGLDFISLLIKLLLAVFCGAAIGLERSAKNRPAGFRTHILVCMGGCAAALTGHYLYLGLNLPSDITRLSGQVITGLGFIGAGTIIVTKKMTIKGLTTAAGLWATGIIGLAIGSGFFEGGLLGTVLVLITETVIAKFEQKLPTNSKFTVEIFYKDKESLDQVMRFCKDQHTSIAGLRIHSLEGGKADYSAEVELHTLKAKDQLIDSIRKMPGIIDAAILD